MRNSKEIFAFIFLSFLFILVLQADGGLAIYDKGAWRMINEDEQICAIHYQKGVQKTILSINIGEEMQGEQMVWIFPVPSSPEKIGIDITKGFPVVFGYEPKHRLARKVTDGFAFMAFSQIYPTIFMPYFLRATQAGYEEKMEAKVHKTLEKMGLTTELVSASDRNAFSHYLTQKKLLLPPDFRKALDQYIGQNYSFVVSWISDVKKFLEEKNKESSASRLDSIIGVSISFPTEKIYYPLKPTAVYGTYAIRTTIYVMNYAMPELYRDIALDTKVKYYYHENYQPPENLRSFFGGRQDIFDLSYTKVEILAPSQSFVQDLWFSIKIPPEVERAMLLNKFAVFLLWLIFIVLSCLSSLIAGKLVFKGSKIKAKYLILLGLANLFTIGGFCVGTLLLKTTEKDQIPQKFGKSAYVFVFSLLFLTLTICSAYLADVLLSMFV